MPSAMSKADWTARAEAYDEAAEHLAQSWTDDPKEREQGLLAAAKIRKDAARCRQIAAS